MKEIRALVFFDLDGTLLNDYSEITDEIAQALDTMRQNGIVSFIATGRTNTEIKDILEKTGITSFITMNGQYAQFEGKTVLDHTIPAKTAQQLYELTQQHGHELALYTSKGIKLSHDSQMAVNHYTHLHQPTPALFDTNTIEDDYNMLLVLGQGFDEVYQQALPDLAFYRNTPYSIDVVTKGHSKGTGVREIIRQLGLEDVPTFAFGDGPNDLELLGACDYKIAMSNAVEQIKNISTHITGDHNDHGIVEGLRYYHLL